MAEPVWEYYAEVNASAKTINFDFEKYLYRTISVGAFDVPIYKGSIGTANKIVETDYTSYTDLYEYMGANTAKITPGDNSLLTGNEFWKATIERKLAWVPPEMKLNVSGQVKSYDNGWVKVDGQLKQIDKLWTRVNGVLREV